MMKLLKVLPVDVVADACVASAQAPRRRVREEEEEDEEEEEEELIRNLARARRFSDSQRGGTNSLSRSASL